jgi:hypothetical protein
MQNHFAEGGETMSNKLLRIYLNDHFAGSAAGRELAKRCLKNNRGNALGHYLEELLPQIEEDQSILESILDRLGEPKDRLKPALAWAVEKAGRLKLNGQLTGYSDLSRLVEVEGLSLGVEGKLSLWATLKELAPSESRLSGYDFDAMIERAVHQREVLEEHRREAAKIAFQ